MKELKSVVLVLMLSSLLMATGCAQGVHPIPPSETISGEELWTAVNSLITNQYAIIALERGQYNGVPIARVQNALATVSMDPNWGPLTRAEALVVEIRRGDPGAAVGLALVGPPERACYRVIVADRAADGTVMLGLVDPLSGEIGDWASCSSAGFVAM